MASSPDIERVLEDRAKLAKVIHRRRRVGSLGILIISLLFTLVATPIVMLDILLVDSGAAPFHSGEQAPMTLRVPTFSGFADERIELSRGSVVVSFHEPVDSATEEVAAAVTADLPSGLAAVVVYAALLFLATLLFVTQLRRSHRGRLLRTQLVTLAILLGSLIIAKILLLTTPISLFAVPLAAVAILMALTVDVSAGLTTALMGSVLFGLAVPFDFGVFAVLGAQSAIPPLVLGDRRHKLRHIALAGLVSGLAAAVLYSALLYLATNAVPFSELSASLVRSSLMATVIGALGAAFLAAVFKPAYQFLLGEITQNKLVELEDLSNPLLKQIASDSPGTWQHSLAMANMAEIAANDIGANGRLVRVGAYYHDLGKSLQPKYFIENLEAGEASPHDRLPPEVSCDAIFAHVTEGIRLARQKGLPERIIDFMHMHHGDGLLEYFWAKCQESGNPNNLTADDFRYPGVPPQSRETAILAICDAVEAASRTLKNPDDQAVSKLVQRIVYGKLHLGQLDESGLSMADLRKISDSLRETIKHAHHGRIEYPWQREERERQAAEAGGESAAPSDPFSEGPSATQRIIAEPRLDSLDVPRPYWRADQGRRRTASEESTRAASERQSKRRELEVAPTAQMSRDEPAPDRAAAADTGSPAHSVVQAAPPAPASPAEPQASPPARPAPAEPAAERLAQLKASSASSEVSQSPQLAESGEAFDYAPTSQLRPDFDAEPPTSEAGPLQPTNLPPPPPGSAGRKSPGTIELMKEPTATTTEAPAAGDKDAQQDDGLAPGTMVIGPPPATRPDTKAPARSVRPVNRSMSRRFPALRSAR